MILKESERMPPEEIRELMRLKNWNTTKLATALGLTENAIAKWLMRGANGPKGPAAILMRQWLAEAKPAQKPKRLTAASA